MIGRRTPPLIEGDGSIRSYTQWHLLNGNRKEHLNLTIRL